MQDPISRPGISRVGEVEALYRYPVKSMAGEGLDRVGLGWHGLDGDRRLGLRRVEDRGGFPWLTASKLPGLILYSPVRRESAANGNLPTHIRTPEGREWPLFSQELAEEIGERHGSAVEMMHLNRGIFDEASVSVITSATVREAGRLASLPPDVRRFRPNIQLATLESIPFEEDQWVGGILRFGEADDGAAIGITNFDERCAMVNLDPVTARPDPQLLKAIVRERQGNAGIYATVIRRGPVAVGQPVYFESASR